MAISICGFIMRRDRFLVLLFIFKVSIEESLSQTEEVTEDPVTYDSFTTSTQEPDCSSYGSSQIINVDVASSNATIEWSRPSGVNNIDYYQISYYKRDSINGDIIITKRVNAKITTYQIDGLEPLSEYVIEVYARLQSDILQLGIICISTLNDVYFTEVSERSIKVRWFETGNYNQYLVFYHPDGNPEEEQVVLVQSPSTEVTLVGLEPDTDYVIEVRGDTGERIEQIGVMATRTNKEAIGPEVNAIGVSIGVVVGLIVVIIVIVLILWNWCRNSQETSAESNNELEVYAEIGTTGVNEVEMPTIKQCDTNPNRPLPNPDKTSTTVIGMNPGRTNPGFAKEDTTKPYQDLIADSKDTDQSYQGLLVPLPDARPNSYVYEDVNNPTKNDDDKKGEKRQLPEQGISEGITGPYENVSV